MVPEMVPLCYKNRLSNYEIIIVYIWLGQMKFKCVFNLIIIEKLSTGQEEK